MTFMKSLLAGAVLAVAGSGAAWAQETDVANGSAFGNWVVNCQAATINRTTCQLIQEQSIRETGQMIARFVAVPATDGAILLAQAPMGVYLPGGAVYRFAGAEDIEQREMIWQSCAGNLCEAAVGLSEEELELFAQHEAILFGFQAQAGAEPVVIRVDIQDFARAISLLRAANG
jgi:invasion protein IalB